MLPGTWAYVSASAFGRAIIVNLYLVILEKWFCVHCAGAFGRAIIVSLYLVILEKWFCVLCVLAIQSLSDFFFLALH